ncbi:MAG TPA: single-stranded DNA-binding protein [Acidobacteriota bacterium]|nr:single-stranded DNA-binding protein [Acidobacteriota bacterium]
MVNKVILIGRLGRDPELRRTASGSAVANFSLATDESWVDANGQRQSRTEWHNIVAWRRLGEICGEFLKKGRLVYIEGKMQTREWDDRDGNKRRTTEVIASNMQMLESKGQAQHPSGEEQVSDMEVGITDDDVPF